MTTRIPEIVKKIASTPPGVLLFRAVQLVQLQAYERLGRWQAISRKSAEVSAAFSDAGMSVLNEVGADEIEVIRNEIPEAVSRVIKESRSTLSGDVRIFGSRVLEWPPDWHSDWRYVQTWAPQYYKQYRFYESKTTPYDVKFPWELSRLHYLISPLAAALFSEDREANVRFCLDTLTDWRNRNPLAHSVNWYPMEASMRTVTLTWLLDFVRMNQAVTPVDAATTGMLSSLKTLIVRTLYEHAAFVWVNREVAKVNGNHFMANVVALILAGSTFRGQLREAGKWLQYSTKHFSKEVTSQFYSDGVQFEKSCGYHKLVTELCITGWAAACRAGIRFPQEVKSRLIAALEFSSAMTRPDGWATNFGDTDDASVIPFGAVSRSHRSLQFMGHALLESRDGNRPLLRDVLASLSDEDLPERSEREEFEYFRDGGYVVVRSRNSFFLMVDVGEVGMRGLGGHGHNDLLSFELALGGQPFFVDPGCSTYTGDLEKKDTYRRTRGHNTVAWRGLEMAELLGPWRISADAEPGPVCVTKQNGMLIVDGSHNGYARFDGGGVVRRTFEVSTSEESVRITDVMPDATGWFESQFHCHPGVEVLEVSADRVRLRHRMVEAELAINRGELHTEQALHSEGYGLEESTTRIHVRCSLEEHNALTVTIRNTGIARQ